MCLIIKGAFMEVLHIHIIQNVRINVYIYVQYTHTLYTTYFRRKKKLFSFAFSIHTVDCIYYMFCCVQVKAIRRTSEKA